MNLSTHFENELRRNGYLFRRYWIESIFLLGLVITLFGGFVFAVLSFNESSWSSGAVDRLIVGFALWLFANGAVNGAMGDVMEETEQRTLEQICISPLPLEKLLLIRASVKMLTSLLFLLIALTIVDKLTAARLQINFSVMLALALGALPSLLGIGYALAGLLLVVKRGAVVQIVILPAIIGLVSLPAFPVNVFAALPYSLGAAAARAASGGARIDAGVYVTVGLNSLLYFVFGLLVFRWFEKRARRDGVLGHL
ncbi:hypothetical protein [Pelomonas cellulosilytica]|uniref:ABC transporter permease n=1 Tax=Pelomonas cellulosilytica TaxID=2906762 RepID=A0ABS8Y3B8_9BURK|nr:hypothetical protein [Pelomonas sp. P8]MCE4558235.1 hypothetical protein [Pelomonas sp. P8]